jgi:hypothetical protein
MDSTSMRRAGASSVRAGEVDWGGLAVWGLAFGLIVYLGLEGGGYDPLVHDQVGVAVWWLLLAGVAVGALPRLRLQAPGWAALALLGLFVAWTALSFGWTESAERTWADLARLLGYLGVFALALLARGTEGARRLVSAVAAGIALVALVGLLSRLHPDWFPNATQTGAFLSPGRERLSYPLNYWNGLGALIAIGLPLLLQLASGARSVLVRGLAAAALPALMLTVFFTLSRAGIAAAAVALAVYLLFASDRLPKLLALLVAGAGGGVLVLAADRREALQDGLLNSVAAQQGDELLLMTVLICLAVGLIQAAISVALREERRPSWSYVPPRRSAAVSAVVAVGTLVALIAFGAPGRATDAWSEFKQPSSPGEGTGRLGSAAGQSRYQFWSAAVKENASEPLTGTGSGTFEYWWARNGDVGEIVRDTHSLYLQTLGELGIVGLAVLAAFLLTVLVGGGRAALLADSAERSLLAAALAGCVAFCLTATFDWMWQIPVLSVALLLLAAALVGQSAPPPRRDAAFPIPQRLAVAVAALAAIAAIAIPLASTSLVRQSEADARDGDLAGALDAARGAQNVQPSAAGPRLQQALVLERMGDLDAARAAARAATERESTNWRTWLVLSRLEASSGRAAAAVDAYRRARSLNPHFSLFAR